MVAEVPRSRQHGGFQGQGRSLSVNHGDDWQPTACAVRPGMVKTNFTFCLCVAVFDEETGRLVADDRHPWLTPWTELQFASFDEET